MPLSSFRIASLLMPPLVLATAAIAQVDLNQPISIKTQAKPEWTQQQGFETHRTAANTIVDVSTELSTTIIGGIAGIQNCICDLDCNDGNECTIDACVLGQCQFDPVAAMGLTCDNDNGVFCDAGQCNGAGMCDGNGFDPCAKIGKICSDLTASCEGGDCLGDEDCTVLNDPPNCIGGFCVSGDCQPQTLCLPGDACDGTGICMPIDGRCCADPIGCNLTTLAACDAGKAPWTTLWNCDCPFYSSGMSENAGTTHYVELRAGESPCADFGRIGDDFNFVDGQFQEIQQVRFLGGPAIDGTGDGIIVFEFFDQQGSGGPTFIDSFAVQFTGACAGGDNDGNACELTSDCPSGICDAGAVVRGNRFWQISLSQPIIVPPAGFFAIRPGEGSGETASIVSTNGVALLGVNNPGQLLFGDLTIGPVLSPELPDILTFEFISNPIPPPVGSCCLGEALCVEDPTANTPWLCDAVGGVFVPGEVCVNGPCDLATCCLPDGSCEVLPPITCLDNNGTVGAFGGNCDLNCCPQIPTSGNDCGTAIDNLLDTASTSDVVSVRISGDSSNATNGTCSISGTVCRTFQADGEDCPPGETCDPSANCVLDPTDQGQWESFTITANSNVEIGYCCTDPDSPAAPGFRWIAIVDDCNNCTTILHDGSTLNDGASGLIPLGCPDGQPTDYFNNLPAGTYNYSVFTGRYCEDAAGLVTCTEDTDCAPGEGLCVTQAGPYEILINAIALPTQACCLESVCLDTVDAVECEQMNGTPLNETPLCVPINPCNLGACCLGAGVCEDNEGAGIDQLDCELNPSGQYIGGLMCSDNPCPVCEIDDAGNCQTDNGTFIVKIDRSTWNLPDDVNRWADDFSPSQTGAFNRLCWWPAFLNPDKSLECSSPGQLPADNWELRLYQDIGGLPGAEIGSVQTITPDAKVSLGPASRIWQYSAPVNASPVLQANQCYWIEITGEGEGPGGCQTYWAMSADGNSYSVNDHDNSYGAEDVITDIAGDPGVDLSFCINLGIGGTNFSADPGCGTPVGACCNPDLTCTDDVPVDICLGGGGIFHPGEACQPGLCPVGGCHANCVNAQDLNAPEDPGDCDAGLPCARDFDTNFCNGTITNVECEISPGNNGTTPIGAAWWYSYTTGPTEEGLMTISACSGNYDGAMAVYDGGANCDCPVDESIPLACGDDTCGVGGGMPTVSFQSCADTCYLIRIGGWEDSMGTGTLDMSIVPGGTCVNISDVVIDNRFDVNSTIKSCTTDADCEAGETGPDPQTVCRDSDGDNIPDSCYVARQRYLSIRALPDGKTTTSAIRVSLDTATAGSVPLGFVQTPTTVSTVGPGPTRFQLARIDKNPDYLDWDDIDDKSGGYLSIGDCEIAPGYNYTIQTILEGADTDTEANYSGGLRIPTTFDYSDVTGGGNPGDPPNGAPGSLVDVFAIVLGFQNTQNEPKDWLDVGPNIGPAQPNLIVGLDDAFIGILAFQQNIYPGPVPDSCP